MIMETTEYSPKEMPHQGSKGVKLELNDSPLNFATSVENYEMHGPPSKKPKTPRDPMSHRIIEKRRRDRMNNCLADLSRLIPANYMKQGQGRIEKTEIIEMAIRHIKHLQNVHRSIVSQGQCCAEKFYLGFKECEAETIRYFVECEGLDSKDQFCMRVISHLEAASQKFVSGNQNCSEYRKEESNADDKGNISSTIGSECENSKPQNLKAEMVSQSVPTILSASHESINSATSKQLRNLLSSSGFEQADSGNGSCADSLSTYSSSESYISNIPHEDGGSLLTNADSESHYRNHSSSEGSSSNSSKDSKFTNYKFKHDITKRFSQEEKFSVDPSAPDHHERILEHEGNIYEKHSHSHEKHSLEKHGHSYEKYEKLSGKLKRKMVRSKSPSSSSDSTVYPTSEHSSNGNGGNMSLIQCRTADSDLVTAAVPLPAFVLHPQGTHYLPLTIQPSCFQNALPQLDRLQQPLVFHPISILVNFSAPGLVIQNAEAFVSTVNPSTAFTTNMCSSAGMNPMTSNSGSSNCSSSSSSSSRRESSSNHSGSGNQNLMNISSGSLSNSSSASSIGNSSSMNCSSGSSSNSSCGSLPPNSGVVTPPNNISGAITTMAPTSTTPIMNNNISHNTMQPNTLIPPVLLSGGGGAPEHHLVISASLQGGSVITTTTTPPNNTNNNNNNINLSTNANHHHPAPPALHSQHHHHLQPHLTNSNSSNSSNSSSNSNNPNSNTNMNTNSAHMKMEERNDNSSNVVSSSHCYPTL